MKDIEDLQSDELFILNSTGGFRPSLFTVSEDNEVYEWENINSDDYPDYEVVELPHSFAGSDQIGVNVHEAIDSRSDQNGSDFRNKFQDYDEVKSEDNVCTKEHSRPISEISAISDDTQEEPILEPLRKLFQMQQQSQDLSNISGLNTSNQVFKEHDVGVDHVDRVGSRRSSNVSSRNESLFDIFF